MLKGFISKSNTESVRFEVEDYIEMTEEQRMSISNQVCRTAEIMAYMNRTLEQTKAIFEYRDPLPRSTLKILETLRTEYQSRSDNDRDRKEFDCEAE